MECIQFGGKVRIESQKKSKIDWIDRYSPLKLSEKLSQAARANPISADAIRRPSYRCNLKG